MSFDTLAFVRRLEALDVSRSRAEAHVDVLRDVVLGELATKSDLLHLEQRPTIRFGVMLAVAIGILATLERFLG